MSLHVENHEGGGNIPDESEYYENRLKWLNENDGPKNNIWSTLAKGEYDSYSVTSEDKELVYVTFPHWFLDYDDKEDWRRLFGEVYGNFNGWAVIDMENSSDNAWYFKRFYVNNRWKRPSNKYRTLIAPRSCFTIYRRDGEPNATDKQKINRRDALPEDVDRLEAEEEDYDWRYALGAAYRRTSGEEENKLKTAKNRAENLPETLYGFLEEGVDEYMRQSKVEGKEVSDDDLAMVINSLTVALEPGNGDE